MADEGENRVQLEDNDDGSAPTEQSGTSEQPPSEDPSAKKSSGGTFSRPPSLPFQTLTPFFPTHH